MTAILLHTARTPVAATAGTSLAGYPASNVLQTQVARTWRGTNYVQIDLGASLYVERVALQSCNWTACTVLADNNATPSTNRGSMATPEDRQVRRKGSLTIGAAVRYIRLVPTGGTTDGAGYWWCGAVYPFAALLALTRDPLYGATAIEWTTPQVRDDLDNGVVEVYDAGTPYAMLNLDFVARFGDDIEAIQRYARAGVCWFDFGIATSQQERALQFPVRYIEPRLARVMRRYNRESLSVSLKEVA